MRNIIIITGSRGEYGYIRPIMNLIQKDSALSFSLIVTNMHMLDEFGNSLKEIEKDGYPISAKIYNTYSGYNNITMVKSLASFMQQLPECIDQLKGDIILISGDRGEQLVAAIVGAYMNIPVAHIQAGELSGNIDGITRHAIARYSHIHFASNTDAAIRLEKMGEQKFRIHTTGAPQLDEFENKKYQTKYKLCKTFGFDPKKPVYIAINHPVTEEKHLAGPHMKSLMLALKKLNEQVLIISPNSDAGNMDVKNAIKKYKTNKMQVHKNISRKSYIGFMAFAIAIIGNSSSGILEAPSFALPAINIGRRQHGRLQGKNVINVTQYNTDQIYNKILEASLPQFKQSLKGCTNPYGDGKSSKRIVEILKNTKISNKLLNKKLAY